MTGTWSAFSRDRPGGSTSGSHQSVAAGVRHANEVPRLTATIGGRGISSLTAGGTAARRKRAGTELPPSEDGVPRLTPETWCFRRPGTSFLDHRFKELYPANQSVLRCPQGHRFGPVLLIGDRAWPCRNSQRLSHSSQLLWHVVTVNRPSRRNDYFTTTS